jgi:uncharacterized protein YndB with AHSA1/START domain
MTTKRSAVHDTFTLERTYDAPVSRVFQAWSDPKQKAKWFAGPPGWKQLKLTNDFRVGGGDVSVGEIANGPKISFESKYYDIIENQRIIYAYEMSFNDTRMSVSVATIEFHAAGAGTRMIVTEAGAFLDGLDNPQQRKEGTGQLLDAIGRSLKP